MDSMLEKLKAYLETEEGMAEAEAFFNSVNNQHGRTEKYVEKVHSVFLSGKLDDIIDKVKTKYDSKKYRDFWFNKGIEPPEDLYWLLYKYAKKYGKGLSESEYIKYSNDFTTDIFIVSDYIVSRMDGQGSFICVEKNEN